MSKRWECRECLNKKPCTYEPDEDFLDPVNCPIDAGFNADWREVLEPVTENAEPWVELPDESRWPHTWHGIYADVIRPALVAIKQLRRRVEGSEKDLREEVFSRCECERLIIKRLEALERGQG